MRGIIIILVCMLIMLGPVSMTLSEVIDKILVVVNNDVITQGEIDRLLIPLYQRYQQVYNGRQLLDKIDEARQAILTQLIEEKLIVAEAKKEGLEVTKKEIDARIADARSKFESRKEFELALNEQHITLKELRAKFHDQILYRKMIDKKLGSRIIVTPIDVDEFYRKNLKEFTVPAEVKLRCILIKPKEGMSRQQAEELANQISQRLKSGEDFAELARQYSDGPGADDGGMMGLKKKGDLMPEIEDVIFKLDEMESSDVVETDIGYFIFKVDQKSESKTSSISEARRFIEDAIYSKRAKEKMKGWIEDLKRHAYIAFK